MNSIKIEYPNQKVNIKNTSKIWQFLSATSFLWLTLIGYVIFGPVLIGLCKLGLMLSGGSK